MAFFEYFLVILVVVVVVIAGFCAREFDRSLEE